MKSVLISIQPKWCELIASGKKTVEVRKTKPKLEPPFKCYIYCTKKDNIGLLSPSPLLVRNERVCNGKVMGEFVCDRVDEITPTEKGVSFKRFSVLHDSCLSLAEIREYLGGKVGYGWHISDLVIYDEPKPLSAFEKPCKCIGEYEGETYCDCLNCDDAGDSDFGIIGCDKKLKRPPQSWCYVEG